MTTAPTTDRNFTAGLTGFALGAVAVLVVLVHHFGGPFNPQLDIGITTGEIAGDIKNAAIAKVTGTPLPVPEPKPDYVDYDRIIKIVGAAAGALAIIIGMVALIRREDRDPAVFAISLGVGAILFQWVSWLALLICGVVVLVSIINNFGDIFDGFG